MKKTGRFAAKLVGSTLRSVGRLISSAPSQVWFVVALAVIAGVAYFGFQEEAGTLVGWSAVPLGLWLVAVLFFALSKRSVLVIRWRWMISSLAFGLAISGGLGIFFAPLASFSGDTYGGDIGVAHSESSPSLEG